MKETITSVSEDVGEIVRIQRGRKHNEIAEWLSPVNYATQQNYFFEQRHPGTGVGWLLESKEFQAWLKDDSQTLFCPGIPGAGKTIMTSVVVNHLLHRSIKKGDDPETPQDDNFGIAYLYCMFKRSDEQTTSHFLLNILKQFVQERSSVPNIVRELYDRCKLKKLQPSRDEVVKVLTSVLASTRESFIIIDALDEGREHEVSELLSEVFGLQVKTKVKLFATSRHIPHIAERFSTCTRLEIRARDEDVRAFIGDGILKLPAFYGRSQEVQQELKNVVETKITEAANGMYVFNRCTS